jgi:hypothetical protein
MRFCITHLIAHLRICSLPGTREALPGRMSASQLVRRLNTKQKGGQKQDAALAAPTRPLQTETGQEPANAPTTLLPFLMKKTSASPSHDIKIPFPTRQPPFPLPENKPRQILVGFLFTLLEDQTEQGHAEEQVQRRRYFDPIFFNLMLLPPIIFESGFHLNMAVFVENIHTIVLLAVVGARAAYPCILVRL